MVEVYSLLTEAVGADPHHASSRMAVGQLLTDRRADPNGQTAFAEKLQPCSSAFAQWPGCRPSPVYDIAREAIAHGDGRLDQRDGNDQWRNVPCPVSNPDDSVRTRVF
jgi:hypothetical protein